MRLAAIAVVGGTAGLVIDGIVDGHSAVWVAATAATAATTIAAVALARRPSGSVLAIVGVAATAVAGMVAAWAAPGRRPGGWWSSFTDAAVHGWSATVRSLVPADAEPRLLVPLAMTVTAATFLAVVWSRRSRGGVVALVPVLGSTTLACVAAGGHQPHPLLIGLIVLAASGAFAATSDAATFSTGRGVAVAGALVALAAAVGLGPLLTFGRDDEPFDARRGWTPPEIPGSGADPLDLVDRWRLGDDTPLFVVRSPAPVSTRIASYEHFDGVRWAIGGNYRRSGALLADAPTDGDTVSATITIDGLAGPWLPVVAEPTRIDGAAVGLEPTSRTVVAIEPDISGIEYRVTAVVAEEDLAANQDAEIADDHQHGAAITTAPGLPAELREMAEVATGGAEAPVARAALLELYLRANFTVAEDRAGGFSYGHLSRAFLDQRAATPAQFAAVYAVLGRVVGLPTRLVVGFEPGDTSGSDAEAAEAGAIVRGTDVAVWPEVHFEGLGWVRFDPVPSIAADGRDRDGVSVGMGPPSDPADDAGSEDTQDEPTRPATTAGPGDSDPATGAATWWRIPVNIVALAAVVVLVAALGTWAIKRRRTARRRRGEPRDRVLGAWHDVLDRLVEEGAGETTFQTVREVVEREPGRSSMLVGLYRPVDRALYGDVPMGPDEADQAWQARDHYVAHRRHRSRRTRVRMCLDPRPLRRRDPARTGGRS